MTYDALFSFTNVTVNNNTNLLNVVMSYDEGYEMKK